MLLKQILFHSLHKFIHPGTSYGARKMLIILCISAVQTFANISVNSHLPFLIPALYYRKLAGFNSKRTQVTYPNISSQVTFATSTI
jgi:hypothetical protein